MTATRASDMTSEQLPDDKYKSIENPAECEIRSVIPFHNSKVVQATETHRQTSEVYGENIMNEGMVRKWVIGHLKMAAGMCMTRKEAGDLLTLLKTWCRKLMEKFERTDALRFHLYLTSFLKFQEVFFMEL
ncbi:hypothetical protein AVEN_65664-1 [Araneus ventricosus]|uniref:Mos1 transposase HTH domain-containing protein n=1 Tax=Araneus ventricosus TaxID=182803 RepID=A0A4Y2TSM5_ARAVE|nr:hypothetical protein AVEN_65664-1 [Araneus ventricosus]